MTTPFERPSADEPLRAAWRGLAVAAPAPGAHLTEDEWVRLAAGEFDDVTHQGFADHIEACAACAEVFRAISHVRAGASAIDPAAPPSDSSPDAALEGPGAAASPAAAPDVRSTRRAWWYGLAAAAAVSLAIGGALWRPAPEPSARVADAVAAQPPQGAAPASAAGTAPVTAPAPTAAPAAPALTGSGRSIPAWALLASAPAVVLPPSLTLVMRGSADVDRDAFLAAFGPAIAPYRARRYEEAARALTDLTRQFPAVSEGWFYLGVSHLHAGDAAAAVEPLRRAQESEVVADDARWLTAVALEHAGRTEEARAAVRLVCGGAGPHRDAACEAAGRPR